MQGKVDRDPESLDWLIFIHLVPPEPLYLRAKILRRIKQLGAAPLKKAAYVLPMRPECLEDFEWLRKEVIGGGGEAWILKAQFEDDESDAAMIEEFRTLRGADYDALASECREARPGYVEKRLREIEAIDFFEAPGKDEVMRLLDAVKKSGPWEAKTKGDMRMPTKAIWVTREGVGVDRMASAWLIRRYIDPEAQFRFAAGTRVVAKEGEIRFDTFEGEYTHQAELCTFEVIRERFKLEEPGLGALAEVIHDLDLKDGKYQRPEATGVAAMLAGLQIRYAGDAERIEQAAALFDALLAQFSAESKAT